RQHNPNHQVSLAIGRAFRGGVIGGVTPYSGDYGATSIDSKTGQSAKDGDITAIGSLSSFAQTALVASGVDPQTAAKLIPNTKPIAGALA
ncbi:MAG TPA: hypothetical protein VHU80_01820, partial [Polyangiaceae bacterium]|nr:hypothetical protein [Polyangiaceae bacterium]